MQAPSEPPLADEDEDDEDDEEDDDDEDAAVDDEADVSGVLSGLAPLRDLDELDPGLVQVLAELGVPSPIRVGSLDDDPPLFQESVENPGHLERLLLSALHTQGDVFEVDEERDSGLGLVDVRGCGHADGSSFLNLRRCGEVISSGFWAQPSLSTRGFVVGSAPSVLKEKSHGMSLSIRAPKATPVLPPMRSANQS